MPKNEKRLQIPLTTAGALISIRLVIMPLIGWQNDQAAQNNRLARQLTKADRLIADTPAMAAQREAIEAVLNNTNYMLDRRGESTELTQQQAIEKLFENADLTLRSFNWILRDALPQGHERLRAEVNLAGSLENFIKGVHALTTRSPHTNAVKIDLKINRREQQLTGRGLNGTILIEVLVD